MDKSVCIGKNYQDHIRELAHLSPQSELGQDFSPPVFIKPPSVLKVVKNFETKKLIYLPNQGEIHFETEIVLRIHKECYKTTQQNGRQYFDAVSIGLDMTLRDIQTSQKKSGFPWTTSKVFPDSAVCGEWVSLTDFPHFETQPFYFTINGIQRQTGRATEMIFSFEKCISYISQFFKLLPGDMIYTGTPAGVGAINPGDVAKLQYGHIEYNVEWVE